MIRVDIHPDKRGKYVVTVRDPGQPDDDILLSSTSQGYENVADAVRVVRRLFGGPHPYAVAVEAAVAQVADAVGVQPPDVYAAGGAGVPEPVELFITGKSTGITTGPERLR